MSGVAVTSFARKCARLPVLLLVRVLAVLWLSLGVLPGEISAARVNPAEATVFIRLIGQVRVLRGEDERVWRELLLDLREVEVATGSGFIVSPQGYVVTNHHVISGTRSTLTVRGVKVQVAIDVKRIEVVVPSESGGGPGSRRFEATVSASDPQTDLAILYIGSQDLPYVALGDSDVVASGQPVEAVGYPFGTILEIGKPSALDTGPTASASTGAISALRTDAAGELRYIQLTAPLNPGNSGGPIVDAEGYAVGVAQMRLEGGLAIGFAVPINLVKRLLQVNGLDTNLPAEILALGPYFDSQTKGLRFRVPYGLEDLSPNRVVVDTTQAANGLAFRIDRIASRWSPEQIEAALLMADTIEHFRATGPPRRSSRTDRSRRILIGHSSGEDPATGRESKLVYAIFDLGREKIVARYTGPAELVAANRSVLDSSLADLDIRPMLVDELRRSIQATWMAIGLPPPGVGSLPAPDGWVVEAGTPSLCAGLIEPALALTISPSGDFTVALRAAWRPEPMVDVGQAARACSSTPSRMGVGSYASSVTSFGVTYHVEGVFVGLPGRGVWQLEMVAPAEKSRFITELFAAWVGAIAPR